MAALPLAKQLARFYYIHTDVMVLEQNNCRRISSQIYYFFFRVVHHRHHDSGNKYINM
jgi:hypothetical protein